MNSNERSKAFYIAAILSAIFIAIYFGYRGTNADLKDVQAVAKSVQSSPAAIIAVESALKKNPTPTVSELAEIKTTADYLVTKKPISKAPESVNAQPVQPTTELHSSINAKPMGFVVKSLLIFGLFCGVILISVLAVQNK